MTKLASALPTGGHGLDTISHRLIEPVARMRRLELVAPDDVDLAERLIRRGLDKRLGATVLPMSIEDDISEAFAQLDALEAQQNPDKDDDDQADYPDLHDELRRAADQLRKAGRFRFGRAQRILGLLADQVESGELPATAHHLLTT